MSDVSGHSDPAQIKKHFLTRGLATLAASQVADVPIVDLAKAVTDGHADGGIDLVHFDSVERTLYLVQSKWHDDGHGSIDVGDALKFIAGVKKVLDNDLASFNSRIQAKKNEIERALYDANAKFMLVLAHTGQEDLSADVLSCFDKYIDAQNDTSELMFFHVLKQAELHKAVATGLAGAPISVEVQLYGWAQVREPHQAVYGKVCANDISTWMMDHGSRLFERNLRQFLGTSTVNQDIVETLVKRPEEFWYFNNGITAVCSTLGKKPLGGNSSESAIFECTGFCVVNGAQTVGSIHAAAAMNPEAAAKAMVSVRIISSEESSPSFAAEVTRFTNTQNAIEKRDFVALDPEQERIRQELHIDGVDYVYKSGAAAGTTAKRFDLIEASLAQACSNPDVSLAVQAKREIGRLWEDLTKAPYKQLFHGGVSGPAVWEAVQILRAIDQALTVAAAKYQGRDGLLCVHGNRFAEWATFQSLGVSAGKTFIEVEASVPSVTEDVLAQMVKIVKSQYPDAYPASLFKNLAKCRVLAQLM
jgi:hypothetical protein